MRQGRWQAPRDRVRARGGVAEGQRASLERMWPGVVSVDRRFKRPQHVVQDAWRRFDTPLKRRADVDWAALEAAGDPFKIDLVKRGEVKSPDVRAIFERERAAGRAREEPPA